MAIDTLAKRNSVLSVNSYILPIPDGTIGDDDRQTLTSVYGGILADVAVIITRTITKIQISIGIQI